MNEEEAWNAFQDSIDPMVKSGATVAGKLDTLAQLLSEIGVDTSRTAETVIPQLAGDQGAIDAANEQAAAGGPAAGAPLTDDMGAPMPPAPDAPLGGDGAPMPDIAPAMPSEGDAGVPGATPGPAPGVPAPEPPMPEEAPAEPPADMPAEPPMPEEAAPGMGAPAPEMGGESLDFAYTADDALQDFVTSMTDEAHDALDAGDTAKVAAITGFLDGVKKLWEGYMGGSMPAPGPSEEPAEAPAEASAEVPADIPAPEDAPAEEPADVPAPASDEGGSDEKPESDEKSDEKKESDSDEKKDDEKKDDLKKSDAEAPVDGAISDIGEGDAEASGDAEKSEDAEKSCGGSEETEMKKSIDMAERIKVMAEVMRDETSPLDGPVLLNKSEMPTCKQTADVDIMDIINEFKNGGVVKSSRPPAAAAMGGFRNDAVSAAKQNDVLKDLDDICKSMCDAPGAEMNESEKAMQVIIDGLRAHGGAC